MLEDFECNIAPEPNVAYDSATGRFLAGPFILTVARLEIDERAPEGHWRHLKGHEIEVSCDRVTPVEISADKPANAPPKSR